MVELTVLLTAEHQQREVWEYSTNNIALTHDLFTGVYLK